MRYAIVTAAVMFMAIPVIASVGIGPPGAKGDAASSDQRVRRSAPAPADEARARELYSGSPLAFEPRVAGAGAQGGFVARGQGYGVFLTAGEVNLSLHGGADRASGVQESQIRMRLVGARRSAAGEALNPLPGLRHYLRGNDPAAWRRNVRTYGRVRYLNVYRGIDVVHYGNQRQLEFDFVVSPGGDPSDVRLAFDGVDALTIDPSGDLVLSAAGGSLHVHKPVVYQEVEGRRQLIDGAYVKSGRRQVRFRVAAYDATRPLVIDPVVLYGTYLGGSADDVATAVAVDASGNAYLTGWTSSSDFPEGATPSNIPPLAVPGPNPRGNDVFVAKIDPSQTGASSLVYVTVLGGSGDEAGRGIALGIEASGLVSAYVAGETLSLNFPTTPGAYQPINAGSLSKGFVLKLDSSGSILQYSSYLGAYDSNDASEAIVVDASGAAYVMGVTSSSVFPSNPWPAPPPPAATWYDHDQWHALWRSAIFPGPACDFAKPFLAKLDPTGGQIEAWTFLPGCAGSPRGSGRKLSSNATSVWVTFNQNEGLIAAPLLPSSPPPPFERYANGVEVVQFGLSLNIAAPPIVVRPSGDDVTTGIDVNQVGDVFVTGESSMSGMPWLKKLDLGSGGYTVPSPELALKRAFAVKADATGNAYVAWGFNFAQSGHLLAKYDSAGNLVPSSIPLNGIKALAVDALGSVYAAGVTYDASSVFFPSAAVQANAFDQTCGTAGQCAPGIADAFLVKTGSIPSGLPVANAGPDQIVTANAVCAAGVTFDGTASTDPDADPLTYTWSGNFGTASGPTPTISLSVGIHTITLTVDDGKGGTAMDIVIVEVRDQTPPILSNVPAPVTVPQNIPVTLALPTATDDCSAPAIVTSDAPAVFPLGPTLVTFTATDASGNRATATTTVTVTAVPVASATGLGAVTFSTSAGRFGSLTAVAEDTLGGGPKPPGFTFPYGFFSWTVTDLTPGQAIVVTMTFPATIPAGSKYGKVVNFLIDTSVLLGSNDGLDGILTLTIADGGFLDADGMINGQIEDPGGVAVPAAPNQSLPGRIGGAGHIDANGRRHHFEFRASEGNTGEDRGSLRYEVSERPREGGRASRFVSTAVTAVVFSDDPAFRPGRRPRPTVDTVDLAGTGRWNGVDGYSFRARAADVGEPGRGLDTFTLTILDPSGATVASVSGVLAGGNIQSTRVKR